MVSLSKFDMATQEKQNYSGNNRKICDESDRAEKNKNQIRKEYKGRRKTISCKEPMRFFKCGNGLVTWKQAHNTTKLFFNLSETICLHVGSILD